jgi:hypothetical protein
MVAQDAPPMMTVAAKVDAVKSGSRARFLVTTKPECHR